MPAPIHLVIPGAALVRDTRHQCPLGDKRITLYGSQAICREHARRLPRVVRDALNAAWDEGRGAESQAFADALAEAKRAGRS
jgi:hypothetical protein